MNDTLYPPSMTLYRDSFRTRQAYLEAYRDCVRHYGFKVRVVGGWRFFEFVTDYETWKNQR